MAIHSYKQEYNNVFNTREAATEKFLSVLEEFISLEKQPEHFIGLAHYMRENTQCFISCATVFKELDLFTTYLGQGDYSFKQLQTTAALIHTIVIAEDYYLRYHQDIDMWLCVYAELCPIPSPPQVVSELRTQYLATQAATASLNSIR